MALLLTLLGMQHEGTATGSPGKTSLFRLPAGQKERFFYLVLPRDRDSQCVEATSRTIDPPNNAVALLISKEGRALLASLVDDCSIEATSNSQSAIVLPKSEATNWHYLNLRPSDNIHFSSHSFTCAVSEQTVPAESPHHETAKVSHETGKLQVESSLRNGRYDSVIDHQRQLTPDVGADESTFIDGQTSFVKADAQVYSTAREGSPDQQSGADDAPHHEVIVEPSASTSTAARTTVQHVLETPVKHKALPHEFAEKTPMILKLEAAEKENHPTTQQGYLADPSHETMVPVSEQSMELPLSRASPDLPTQASTSPSITPVKRKRTRAPAKMEETESIAPRAKKPRQAPGHEISTIPTQPATARAVRGGDSEDSYKTIVMTQSVYKDDKSMLSWLRKQGCKVSADIPTGDGLFTCVVSDGTVPRTSKLLRSLARDVCIVKDKWLADSQEADELLERSEYIPDELQDTIAVARSFLLTDRHIFTTSTFQTSLKAGWKDFVALAKELGAENVEHGTLRKLPANLSKDSTIFIGNAVKDAQAQQLIEKLDCQFYTKELLVESVVQGKLLLDDEAFLINSATPPSSAPRSRKR